MEKWLSKDRKLEADVAGGKSNKCSQFLDPFPTPTPVKSSVFMIHWPCLASIATYVHTYVDFPLVMMTHYTN